ncbi:MAG: pre-peptidase C-terminal domain-containing protein [Chloroflexi bacterium]|nr:pre-peptidase C-terminal domain-containing protein [Chloroflexota bacterium]
MRRINVVLILVLTLSFLSSGPAIYAQGGDAEAEINRLARAAHIQNLRTGSVTRWVGGDLGRLNGSETLMTAGTVIEDFEFPDIYDETNTVRLSGIERPVVINMWASWCGPCRFEFPFLTDIAKNQDINYDLWFLNTADTSDSAARRFLRTQEGGISVFMDVNNEFNREVGMVVLPTTLMVGTDGRLLAAHSGIVTPTIMNFYNAVAANPELGTLNADDITEEDLLANIEEPNIDAATEIIFGQQVAGEINDVVWQFNYKFEGEEGQAITIEMNTTDEDMDPYLVLLGPDGERVAENDDGPVHPNAFIQTTLPESGTYVIVATRWLEVEGFAFGGYTLQLVEGAAAPDSTNNVATLQPNIPLSGRLTRDRSQDAFLFSANEGQVVTFILEHDTEEILNFQVRIGAGERVVPFTQTEGGRLEVEVTMPADTDYSVYVSRPSSSREGPISYTLTAETSLVVEELGPSSDGEDESSEGSNVGTAIDQAEGQVDSDETDAPEVEETDAEETEEASETQDAPGVETAFIEYGDVVTYSITNDTPGISYTFVGNAGDVIIIEMAALEDGLDPLIILYGPTGAMFAANDDNGRTQDAAIVGYTLPMDGEYSILATRYGERSAIGGTGDFQLSLEIQEDIAPDTAEDTVPDEADAPPVIVVGASLEDGDTVNGTIDVANVEARYTFSAEAGDKVMILMTTTSGNLDTYLSVLDSSGRQLGFNDDNFATTDSDSLISNLTIRATGSYTIVATRYGGSNGSTSGDFTLELDISR